MATAWQMIYRNKMGLCRNVDYNHMPLFKYQWEMFYFKKDRKEFCFRESGV